MKRTELRRKTELKRGTTQMPRSTKPIPQQSKKTIAQIPEREAMRKRVIARDGGCVGPRRGLPGACGTLPGRPGLEVHEVEQRSTHPGSHLRDEAAVSLCAKHHSYCTSPVGEARELVLAVGLIVKSSS